MSIGKYTKKIINIATYADNFYVQHATVMIQSLSEVCNQNYKYNVYFFYSQLSETDHKKLVKSINNLPGNLSVYLKKIPTNNNDRLKSKNNYVNPNIYNKLKIYNNLDNKLGRIIFFDCDIVFQKDPAILYDFDLEGKILGAVKEKKYLMNKKDFSDLKALNLSSYHQYFNSGMMIIDLRKWFNYKITNKAFHFATNYWHLTNLHDQDALNYAIGGNWIPISPLWNPRGLNEIRYNNKGKYHVLTNFDIYKKNISYLVHYSGADKPWYYLSTHPKKSLYLYYLKKTAFKDYKYPDFNLINLIVKVKNKLKSYLIYTVFKIK